MKLLEFMNTYVNWKELIAAEPYCVDVRQDNDYFILKYNMILSDMSLPEVQEARGSIFREQSDGQWICVCHPFDKFFNYGEKESAVNKIDWETAEVQEKIDGSLIKLWFDKGDWHVSTNGTIDAFKAECGETTFGDLFFDIIGRANISEFFSKLHPSYTYMFELVSPAHNHIVVHYMEDAIYFLGCRNMVTDMEETIDIEFDVEIPQVFPHHSLSECIAAAHEMGDDEEGYVVCDANFNRIKIKGDEYLALHKMRGNGPLTVLRVIEMWQNETLDDFIAYYPEFKDFIDGVLECIRHWISAADLAFNTVRSISIPNDRKLFAINASSYLPIIRSYLFARLDEKTDTAANYIKNMRSRTLASYVMTEISKTTIGVKEDE